MWTITCEIDDNGTQKTFSYKSENDQRRAVRSLLHQGFAILNFGRPSR